MKSETGHFIVATVELRAAFAASSACLLPRIPVWPWLSSRLECQTGQAYSSTGVRSFATFTPGSLNAVTLRWHTRWHTRGTFVTVEVVHDACVIMWGLWYLYIQCCVCATEGQVSRTHVIQSAELSASKSCTRKVWSVTYFIIVWRLFAIFTLLYDYRYDRRV